jgi:asparagine synthase (glutamine-hydrolysing)
MCGIAGIVVPDAIRYESHIERMVKSLGKRGPDDKGVHFYDRCALGHTRLSIVDLETGRQPMISETFAAGIVFNGEIYGYKSIRAMLKDHTFHTSSDTEVILALYHRGKDAFLKNLPGMFAFAIWDEDRQQLFCARDRFGEKPLFYCFGRNGEFLFASEIKSLLASGLVRPVLDMDSITHYMRYLYVHPHRTIYRNIFTLPPGHFLRLRNGQLQTEPYWILPSIDHSIGFQDAQERIKALLDKAVEKQLVADVEVGAFLSGGLDSSAIVCLASRHKKGLRTFSFGFGESVDEQPYARQIAKLCRTEHTELEDDHADLGQLLLEMQEVYDEPFADSSNIPTYMLSKLARKHVKVVLTGDGGDEMFGGYTSWYRPLMHMKPSVPRSRAIKYLTENIVEPLARAKSPLSESMRFRLLGMAYGHSHGSISGAHASQKRYFLDRHLESMGLNVARGTPAEERGRGETVDAAIRMDIADYMPGDILVKIDRASMNCGLELRAPFLDVDFASFCVSLPFPFKIHREIDKYILRESFRKDLPGDILNRRKQGFGAPVDRWLRTRTVASLKKTYLDDAGKKIFRLLSYEGTRDVVRADDYRTWILLVLSLWLERHECDIEEFRSGA